jgi:hypothetical protein
MANIIASGTSEASAEFALTAGTPTTVFIVGPVPADAKVAVQQKSAGGTYTSLGELNQQTPATTIYGGGTVRVIRQACANACAVDRD